MLFKKAMNRPAVPAKVKRKVLVEAGHRCAIPTCKQTTTEIAHIVPWAECQGHEFKNLIALCPNCHTRFDKGEIDRKSIEIYKENLSIVSQRYGDIEQRVLKTFADDSNLEQIRLPDGFDVILQYAILDGLIEKTEPASSMFIGGQASHNFYSITKKGRNFIKDWKDGQRLE